MINYLDENFVVQKSITPIAGTTVELIACEMTMNVMEIAKEDLIDGVKIAGVATFIAEASESKIQLFI